MKPYIKTEIFQCNSLDPTLKVRRDNLKLISKKQACAISKEVFQSGPNYKEKISLR